MKHDGITTIDKTSILPHEPPLGRFPWVLLEQQLSWEQGAYTHRQYEPASRPFWMTARIASFTDAAKEAGASLPKSEAAIVQKVEDSFGKLAKEISKLRDPAYIETKVSALAKQKLSGTEHVAALTAIESECASLPSIIDRLLLECAELEAEMKSAAQKIAEQMLENVAQNIEKRIKTLQADAKQLHFPIPSRCECLRRDPVPSLCRLGSQIECVNDELASPAHTWRIRNLLSLAGVIKPAAPVSGLTEEDQVVILFGAEAKAAIGNGTVRIERKNAGGRE
jgi:hypothetical protein